MSLQKQARRIGIVINAHNEGEWLLRAALSACSSESLLDVDSGMVIDKVLVLDCPDSSTVEVAEKHVIPLGFRIVESVARDVGVSRNIGIASTRPSADTIALLDGDDLWGPAWLDRAVAYEQRVGYPCVLHPEVNVYFGVKPHVYAHPDSAKDVITHFDLAETNAWTSLCLARRSVFEAFPYEPSSRGYGFEDWAFNRVTLAADIPHLRVPRTCHFIRTKGERRSLLATQSRSGMISNPPRLKRQL
jgi:glycosyltransferase involved in cell wall biosynthesis